MATGEPTATFWFTPALATGAELVLDTTTDTLTGALLSLPSLTTNEPA